MVGILTKHQKRMSICENNAQLNEAFGLRNAAGFRDIFADFLNSLI